MTSDDSRKPEKEGHPPMLEEMKATRLYGENEKRAYL